MHTHGMEKHFLPQNHMPGKNSSALMPAVFPKRNGGYENFWGIWRGGGDVEVNVLGEWKCNKIIFSLWQLGFLHVWYISGCTHPNHPLLLFAKWNILVNIFAAAHITKLPAHLSYLQTTAG